MKLIEEKNYDLAYSTFKKSKQTIVFKNWINPNSQILEFACHTGLLARLLFLEKNCTIDGIEGNREALEKAKKWLRGTYNLDIEDIKSYPKFNKKYDYIIFSHILEHLRNPEKVLEKSKEYLKDNGYIIIALPNISNIRERLDMMMGKFEYTEAGIMDSTHYKMFNYYTAIKMIKNCGLQIEEYDTPFKISPIKYILSKIPLVWRVTKILPSWFLFSKNKHNLTDVVLLYKCKIKL